MQWLYSLAEVHFAMTVAWVIMFRIKLRYALLDDFFARPNGYLTMIFPWFASWALLFSDFLNIHVMVVWTFLVFHSFFMISKKCFLFLYFVILWTPPSLHFFLHYGFLYTYLTSVWCWINLIFFLIQVKDFQYNRSYSWGGAEIKVWFGKVEGLSVYFLEPQNG